jgi:hypothetical protein
MSTYRPSARRPRPRRLLLTAAAVTCALGLAACGGASKKVALPKPTPSASPTTASPTPSPTPGTISPLTGLPGAPGLPVIGVKVDNVVGAFPQSGVDSADMVFVEQVEGGLTRLLAIFSSKIPQYVGPVRSARTDNIELLHMFGTPALAFSGANAYVLSAVRSSNLKKASQDDVPSAYHRISDHAAPHNLLADPAALLKATMPPAAKSMGLTFNAAPATGGTPATEVTAHYPDATLVFDYDAKSGTYVLTQDGAADKLADGKQRAADTVIAIHVTSRQDYDPITPYNITVGTGKGTLFRDGREIPVVWHRATETNGMTFTGAGGLTVPAKPGQTWVVVLPADASASSK